MSGSQFPARNRMVPTPNGRPKTLGDARQGLPSEPNAIKSLLNETGRDAHNNPAAVSSKDMAKLLTQKVALKEAENRANVQTQGDEYRQPPQTFKGGPIPADKLPPNVVQNTRQAEAREAFLPADFDRFENAEEQLLPPEDFRRIPEGKRLLTNNPEGQDKQGLRPPPAITPSQARARAQQARVVRAPDEDKQTNSQAASYSGKPRFVLKKANYENAKFIRLNLLSGCVFYPFKEVEIRKFGIEDHLKVMKAQELQDITMLIDAIGNTLNNDVDIRDFTVPDWLFTLFWHRINSYTSTPYVVTWTSKYGNANTYKITETSLTYTVPTITEDEYAEWQAQGFVLPTLREWEVGQLGELNEDENILFNRAQWFAGVPNADGVIDIQQKIDGMQAVCENDLGALGKIPAFQAAVSHSLSENIDVTDALFDPRKWVEVLDTQIEFLTTEAAKVQALNPMRYVNFMSQIEEYKAEADGIAETLEKGGEVQPDIETINLQTNPLSFFPSI